MTICLICTRHWGESKGEREVFQIDGNFGAASGIASMLYEVVME